MFAYGDFNLTINLKAKKKKADISIVCINTQCREESELMILAGLLI